MSNVAAVIAEPPSSPLIIKSLSCVLTVKTASVELLLISRTDVPPSLNVIFAPSASSIISPATSTVRSPDDKSISVPSIVMLSTVTPPSASRDVALIAPKATSPALPLNTSEELLASAINVNLLALSS